MNLGLILDYYMLGKFVITSCTIIFNNFSAKYYVGICSTIPSARILPMDSRIETVHQKTACL